MSNGRVKIPEAAGTRLKKEHGDFRSRLSIGEAPQCRRRSKQRSLSQYGIRRIVNEPIFCFLTDRGRVEPRYRGSGAKEVSLSL